MIDRLVTCCRCVYWWPLILMKMMDILGSYPVLVVGLCPSTVCVCLFLYICLCVACFNGFFRSNRLPCHMPMKLADRNVFIACKGCHAREPCRWNRSQAPGERRPVVQVESKELDGIA